MLMIDVYEGGLPQEPAKASNPSRLAVAAYCSFFTIFAAIAVVLMITDPYSAY